MRDLIVTAGRLITLINEETELLERFEAGKIATLQDEKARLTRIYAGLIRDLRSDPDVLAAADKAVRDELTEVLTAFNQAALANERALTSARAANERVMRAIIDAANAQQQSPRGYSRAGTLPPPARAAGARPLSLAVDQRW
jgi:hypothetical protein